MEAVQIKLSGVTKTTATVSWVWQRKARPVRVNGYQVMLRTGSEMQSRFEAVCNLCVSIMDRFCNL